MSNLGNVCFTLFDLVALPAATAISIATGEDAVSHYVDDLKDRVKTINENKCSKENKK